MLGRSHAETLSDFSVLLNGSPVPSVGRFGARGLVRITPDQLNAG